MPSGLAVLAISLGLACLLQSVAFFAVFVVYLVLILPLVSREEQGLQKAYGPECLKYMTTTERLLPAIY